MPKDHKGREYSAPPIFTSGNSPSAYTQDIEARVAPHRPFWDQLEADLRRATSKPQLLMLHRQALEKTDIPPELEGRKQRFLDKVLKRLRQCDSQGE